MAQTALHHLEDWRDALQRLPRVLLFKHSPICPVSHAAHDEWQHFLGATTDIETLFVDVIADRPVARGLAEACGVPHASPQVILFEQGRPVWHASHGAITSASLAAAWAG